MQQDFTITGSPTGFLEGDVTLTGYFEYDWDPNRENLLDHKIVIISQSRDQFIADTGVTYKFTNQTFDRSQLKQYEGPWPQGLGYRDTLHLVAIIFVTYTAPGGGQITEELESTEINDMGNRYYIPVQ